jgi:TonB family protein
MKSLLVSRVAAIAMFASTFYAHIAFGKDQLTPNAARAWAKADQEFESKWKGALTWMPKPEYPYEARVRFITGKGLFLIHIDEAGKVTDVRTKMSAGYAKLDDAAHVALRQWRAKPGSAREFVVPFDFVLNGRSNDPGFRKDGLGLQGYRDR